MRRGYSSSKRQVSDLTSPPPRPTIPTAPTENGRVPCNEPLRIAGVTVGYCERLVKWRHRGRERGTHRGPHRLSWWS